MTIREELESREHQTLAPAAAKSSESRGRRRPESEDEIRPSFQRDRDRIIHSKAFRRLKHKTQVFFWPAGDHYRTRLTHTLEVAQIARTIAKALRLHEELTEAISLGHDLGHPPFGHHGERVLAELLPGGFDHSTQSLRIVDMLEDDGKGLNLTFEVRDGISKHSKGRGGAPVDAGSDRDPVTLEGRVARISDLVAYVNHDIDDAIRAGLLQNSDLPAVVSRILGGSSSARIGTMVKDVIKTTLAVGFRGIAMSDEVLEATLVLRRFLFERVYDSKISTAEFRKASGLLLGLAEKLREDREHLLDRRVVETEGLEVAVVDFLAGMTDRYAVALYERLFIPRPWVEVIPRRAAPDEEC
jgi:dGTPase